MGDVVNLVRILGEYSTPNLVGYRNPTLIPHTKKNAYIRTDSILFVYNSSYHRLRSEDPNKHLENFLQIVDSLNHEGILQEETRVLLFPFSLLDRASDWL